MTRPHSTHHDDCGCLSERHAQQIADANAAIKRLTRERDEAVARWNATAGASQRDLDDALVEQRRYSFALAAAEASESLAAEAVRLLRRINDDATPSEPEDGSFAASRERYFAALTESRAFLARADVAALPKGENNAHE